MLVYVLEYVHVSSQIGVQQEDALNHGYGLLHFLPVMKRKRTHSTPGVYTVDSGEVCLCTLCVL